VALCNKNLTPLQRRSMQRMSVALILTVLTNFSSPGTASPFFDLFPTLSHLREHPSVVLLVAMAAISVAPVLFAVWVASSYLKAEPDEFIRALVVRALLWGIAVTMAGDAIVGVLTAYGHSVPIGLLNADLLFVSTAIAFRLLQRSYR
jgi:hypothetical protein